MKKFLKSEFCLIIDNDGGVIIRRSWISHDLTFWNDILRIEYEKDISEIVNFVKFSNWKGLNFSYSDDISISQYGKRVMYISDERFVHREAAIEYIEWIFKRKSSPIIRIWSLVTLRGDINIFDKISISNWEKNLPDNLVVNSITFLSSGLCSLDVGVQFSRSEEMWEI